MKTICISKLAVLVLAAVSLVARAQQTPYPFSDGFESGMGHWVTNGTWGVTTFMTHGSGHALTDSPGSYYTNGTLSTVSLAAPISLAGARRPALGFWHRSFLEAGFDFGYVDVSLDGGTTWEAQPLATVTGVAPTMTFEQLNLGAFVGRSNLNFRFRLVADASVVMDGLYLDDVRIDEAPEPVASVVAAEVRANSVRLGWSASTTGDLAAYRIYRSLKAGVDWHTDRLVGEIADRGGQEFTDVTVCPKTKYYYLVVSVGANGLQSPASEVAVQTLAGTDYPFVDNGEAGARGWVATFPWTLSDEDAFSPTHAWTDSPGGNYENSIDSLSLTLAGPMQFLTARSPILSFNQKWAFEPGDSGNVEISLNNGAEWKSLASVTGTSATWQRTRIDLAGYAGQQSVLLRFRITSSFEGTADGWHLDDISVAESPSMVPAPVLSEITPHSIRVAWQGVTDDLFSHYAILRSTSPGVGINSAIIGTVSDVAVTSFVDTDLILDTTYYYRVYAVNRYGTFSPDSPVETSARTLNNPVPFTADFESSNWGLDWKIVGTWGTTDWIAHGGGSSFTDSPETISGNVVSTAETSIDLTQTRWPVLRFWDSATFGTGYGRVELSSDGSSWTPVYGVYGQRTNWSEQVIDLSPWRSVPKLRLRLTASGGGDGDGWYVDDLTVREHEGGVVKPTFLAGFEDGLRHWLAGGWEVRTNNPYQGEWSAYGSTQGGVQTVLTLGDEVDLTGMTNPQMTFWLMGGLGGSSAWYMMVSRDGGVSWDAPVGVGTPWWAGWSQDWTRYQLSLMSYVGQKVRLRFGVFTGSGWIQVDKLAVEELPPAVVLEAVKPSLKTIEVQWSKSELGERFKRYDVYRDSTLIGSFTDANRTSMVDSGLLIGATYNYKVCLVDMMDAWVYSNERNCTTVPLGYPFTDTMDTMDQWVATGSWAVDAQNPLEGVGCFSDSPGMQETTGMNGTYAMTAINMSGSQWPLLRFYDRCDLAGSDYGAVEVASDGASWTRVYQASGVRTDWAEHVVDLSPWRNVTNLRIRLFSGVGTGGGDGWFVDQMTVKEHVPGVVRPTFLEGFEGGGSHWISSGWEVRTNNAYEGEWSAYGTSPGGVQTVLTLADELDLTGMVNPQMTFWLTGGLGGSSAWYMMVSRDGGVNWDAPAGVGTPWWAGWSQDWTRYQVPLGAYVGQRVRFRFGVFTGSGWIQVDKLAVEELPAAAVLEAVEPYLKTIEVRWSRSGLGDHFKRYDVYRDSTLIGSFTDANQTTMIDSGLLIGATYNYKVCVVDTMDAWVYSNERNCTTVPLSYPFADAMDSMDQWVATGSWAVDAQNPKEGLGSLSDSPGIQQTLGMNGTYAMTAVNMTGSQWPVLRFQDRYDLAGSDYGAVEVAPDGASWTRVYQASGVRTNWSEHVVDLSPWRNVTNLRIRLFSGVGTGGGEGWFVDQMVVNEHVAGVVYPAFVERFEDGLLRWIPSGWEVRTNNAHEGGWSAYGSSPGGVQAVLTMADELDLTGMTNPQMTFWLTGGLGGSSAWYMMVSRDGGVNWDAPVGVGTPWWAGWSQDWTRYQLPLSNYLGQKVRIRFGVFSGSGWLQIDKLSVQELPPPVVMEPVENITTSTLGLRWVPTSIPNFGEYRIYRAEDASVSINSTLVATIRDRNTTTFTDGKLFSRKTYYYKVILLDDHSTATESNQASATTLGVPVGWTETFETFDPVWTVTGSWTNWPGAGRDQTWGLIDSPGDHVPGDSWAVASVDLSTASWPVFRFWDRCAVSDSSVGVLEISGDGGSSWTIVYDTVGTRTTWKQQTVDLSAWRGLPKVWFRFRTAIGNSQGDGWYIDDVSLAEFNPPDLYPFLETWESPTSRWLEGDWDRNNLERFRDQFSIQGSTRGRQPRMLTLAGVLDLRQAVQPSLTYWMKAGLGGSSYVGIQVSSDDGRNWISLWSQGTPWWSGWSTDWTRYQFPLADYVGKVLRLRFIIDGGGSVWVDNVGVGEPAPEAPVLAAPWGDPAEAEVAMPTLIVNNAIDYQSDTLTYRFEVFSDTGLAALVRDVPVVATGAHQTAWQVDTNLNNQAHYWWRCRATDNSTNEGPWMATGNFYISLTNHPPNVVALVAPVGRRVLADTSGLLSWYPSTDVDPGDSIASYHLQVADDSAFTRPAIDEPRIMASANHVLAADLLKDILQIGDLQISNYWTISVPLHEFQGSASLQAGHRYYWRVRARDDHGAYSDWSMSPARASSFWFGSYAPTVSMNRIQALPDGRLQLEWDGELTGLQVEFTPTLSPAVWVPIGEPANGTSIILAPDSGSAMGFYRLRILD